jgi:hypothetical protein
MSNKILAPLIIFSIICACFAIFSLEDELTRLKNKVTYQEFVLHKIHKQNITIKKLFKEQCISN